MQRIKNIQLYKLNCLFCICQEVFFQSNSFPWGIFLWTLHVIQNWKDFVNVPTELINMEEVVKTFQYWMHCAEDDWQITKYPFVLGRLSIELNHSPLLENNVVLTLHYAKIIESWDNGRVAHLGFIYILYLFLLPKNHSFGNILPIKCNRLTMEKVIYSHYAFQQSIWKSEQLFKETMKYRSWLVVTKLNKSPLSPWILWSHIWVFSDIWKILYPCPIGHVKIICKCTIPI